MTRDKVTKKFIIWIFFRAENANKQGKGCIRIEVYESSLVSFQILVERCLEGIVV